MGTKAHFQAHQGIAADQVVGHRAVRLETRTEVNQEEQDHQIHQDRQGNQESLHEEVEVPVEARIHQADLGEAHSHH